MHPLRRPIPGENDWFGYENDLDAKYAHGRLFGKSVDQVEQMIGQYDALSIAEDLHFMPRRAFQYYIFAVAQYLQNERAFEDSDAASSFLSLLIARETEEPGSVSEIYAELEPAVEFVAARQKYFDASVDIYGSFSDLGYQLRLLCDAPQNDA